MVDKYNTKLISPSALTFAPKTPKFVVISFNRQTFYKNEMFPGHSALLEET